jgi:RecB family exonuclease
VTAESGLQVPARLSPAALARFRVCERQFLHVDVERLPRREQSNPLFMQGNAIHAALERFFGLRPEERIPPDAVLQQALRSQWRSHWKPEKFATSDLEIEFGNKALSMLGAFPEHFDTTVEPLAREQWVQTVLPNGIELFGKADRIDPFEDGLDIVDYKTGKYQLDEDDLAGEPAAQVYALAGEATFGLPVRRVRYLYLASGSQIAWWPERDDMAALAERLTELTDAIRSSEFPASPGDHCRWCPAALRCTERGRVELAELQSSVALPF